MRQLTSSDLAEIEGRLRADRAAALERIRSRLEGRDDDRVRTLVNHFAEGDSRAAAELLDDTELALLRHQLAELDAIDGALKRIDFGTGGLCIVCGDPIPIERLRAEPAAQACLGCQARLEAHGAGATPTGMPR